MVEGDKMPGNETPWILSKGGKQVGKLTSLAYSPRLEKNIALGFVSPELAELGTELSVATWDGLRQAVVSPTPFLPKLQSGNARELFASTAA